MNTESNNSIGIIFDAVSEIGADLDRLNGVDLIFDVLTIITSKGAQR